MANTNVALSQRENYVPSGFTKFLWWLATAEKELLADTMIDRNRYAIIGMSVLATWGFATVAWTYFFSTVCNNSWLAVPLGSFMGFIILTIDRALIKGVNRFNKKKLLPLIFRSLLALTIGTFMAQPALLYLFNKEIKLQTSLDNEKRKMIKSQELDSLYKNKKDELLKKKETLQKEATIKYAEVAKARDNFLAETDGSGGSGKIGIKDIAIAKRNEYRQLADQYNVMLSGYQPVLAGIETELRAIEDNKEKEQTVFAQTLNDGFLTQVEALNNLLDKNNALESRYYLLIIILVLIELMPVIAKTLLPAGSYDEKVFLREEMEKQIAHSNRKKEQELKETYNTLAQQNNSEAIIAFFELTKEDKNEKIKIFSKKWKEENLQTFDGLWEKMKKEILTKQEN